MEGLHYGHGSWAARICFWAAELAGALEDFEIAAIDEVHVGWFGWWLVFELVGVLENCLGRGNEIHGTGCFKIARTEARRHRGL